MQAIWGCRVFGVFCIGVDFSECAVEASRIYIPEYGKTFHLPDYSYDKAGNQENSILFRVALWGEVLKDTFLYNFSEKTFLFYFPKDSAAYSLKRGDELLVCTRLSPPANNGNPDEFDYACYLLRKGVSGTAYVRAGHWCAIGCDSTLTFRQQALECRSRLVALYRDMGFREMTWRYSLRLQ